MDSLIRYLDMLSRIPKDPLFITTPELLKQLQNAGYDVDLRTVQRDLIKLSGSSFSPIFNSGNTKPLQWSWPSFHRVHLPTMTSQEALTFKLVETFLDGLLPPAIKQQLSDYFQSANSVIQASPLANWVDKIRIIPSSLSLQPPAIADTVLDTVYQALLTQRQISAIYQGVDQTPKSFNVHPLGLVFRNKVIYLVATIGDSSNIKQLALHRFIETQLTELLAASPSGFLLETYINQGEFDYPVADDGSYINLKLRIGGYLKQLLSETPLHDEQQIWDEGDEFILETPILDTAQLRWWIRSFATEIEVLEPFELREEFAAEAMDLNKIYRKN